MRNVVALRSVSASVPVSVSASVFPSVFLSVFVLFASVSKTAPAAIPLQINYQGRVAVAGQPFDGNGLFRFTLADRDTSLTIWCNDGSQVGLPASSTPTAAVNLPVISGIFNVRLGDTIFPNMTALPSTVFDSDRVMLRTWFDDGTHGNALLLPDQPITSVAYAFHAASADTATTATYVINDRTGIMWVRVTGTSQQAQANRGYLADNATTMVTITLPTSTSIAIGDTIRVSGLGLGGWRIAQNAGQKIKVRNLFESTWTARESNRNWGGVASSADGTKLVACVMNSGQIYTSWDSGVTWTPRESNRDWRRVASSWDGAKLVASVWNGQLYTSSDSGVTWTPRESNRTWTDVASSADGTKLVACVPSGQLYTSSDSGVTWTARESTRDWSGVASSADGSKLVACADGPGLICTSTDSGVTWTPRDSSRRWTEVSSSSDGTRLIACVYQGQIYTSSDSGVTWTPRESNRNWYGVASSADGRNLAACADGAQVYTSSDWGGSWTGHGLTAEWRKIASSADGTTLIASVANSQIYVYDSPIVTTSIGTAGYLCGWKNSAVELQYIGDNTFIVLSHEGSLSAN